MNCISIHRNSSNSDTIPHLHFLFFFNDTATTEIYTLSLHDALPICWEAAWAADTGVHGGESWRAAAWIIAPVLAVFSLPRLVTRVDWPFRAHREAYLFTAGIGYAVSLGLSSLVRDLRIRG